MLKWSCDLEWGLCRVNAALLRGVIKAKFHYAIWSQTGPKLVADLQRAAIWPII